MQPSLEVLLEQLGNQNGESELRLGDWGSRQAEICVKFRVNLIHLALGSTKNLMIAEFRGIFAVGENTTQAIENLKLRLRMGVESHMGGGEGEPS